MPYTSRSKAPGAGVTAILGPTNTGKTYMAIERMMTHQTGVIGYRCACSRARST